MVELSPTATMQQQQQQQQQPLSNIPLRDEGQMIALFDTFVSDGRDTGSKRLIAIATHNQNYGLIADFVQYLFTTRFLRKLRLQTTSTAHNEPPKKRVREDMIHGGVSEEENNEEEQEDRRSMLHNRLRALYQQLLRLQDSPPTEQTQRNAQVVTQQLVLLQQAIHEEEDEFDMDSDSEESENNRPFSENNPPDEALLTAQAWLPHLISRGDIDQLDLYLQLLRESKGVCGATWRPGQVAFKCRTCEKDPTCAICQQCFLNGNHEGHNYSLIRTSSGMCDCGDPDSWDSKGFCVNHKGPAQDPTEHLPLDMRESVRAVFTGIVRALYHLTVLTETKERNLIFVFEILEDYCKQSPAIKRFVLQALLQIDTSKNRNLLDLLLQKHTQLSYTVGHWIYQFYSACIADAEFKKNFAIQFTRHYKQIMKSYFGMPSKSGKSHLSSITVQLFTVPPIAEMLCKEHHLLDILMDCLVEICDMLLIDDEHRKRKIIDVTNKKFMSPALWHYFYDLGYVLMHNSISNQFLFDPKYFGMFLKFLSHYQYCIEVRRIDSDDDTWQKSVNFEFRMMPKLFRYITNGIDSLKSERGEATLSDVTNAISLNMSNLKEFFLTDSIKFKQSSNPKAPQIIYFPTAQGPISFHIPLHKMVASIMIPVVKNWEFDLRTLFQIRPDDHLNAQLLMEHPLRICATISHVRNRLWPRNNMHIGEQTYYYDQESWADYALCQDVFLLQLCACMMNQELFFTSTLDRYMHNQMFPLKVPAMEKDQEQLMNVLELDYMHFILTVWSDRNMSGLSQAEACRKFILHSLFKAQGTFSSLQESVPKHFRVGIDLEDIVKEVADYHSPKQSHEQGYFTVKKQFWNELDPYFISYSPKQLSKIEENYRKLFHKDLVNTLPTPVKPFPSMTQLDQLIHVAAYHRLLFTVLYRTVTNENTAESLTICALHGIILILETIPYDLLDAKNNDVLFDPAPNVDHLYDITFPSQTNLLTNILQEFIVSGDTQRTSMLSLLLNMSDKKGGSKEVERSVNRILKTLCNYDERCKLVIDQHNATVGKDTSDKEREKKKKRAMARQKKIMMSFDKKHNSIDERMFGAVLSPEEDQKDNNEKKCAFCHESVSPGGYRTFAMISHVSLSNTLNVVEAQNLEDECADHKGKGKDVASADYKQLKLENEKEWWKPSNTYIGKYNELFCDIKTEKCVQLNCCSHICHFDCFDSYFKSLLTTTRHYKGERIVNLSHKEILCPVCGRLANELCPIVHESSSSNDTDEHRVMKTQAIKPAQAATDLTLSVKKLARILRQSLESGELLTTEGYNLSGDGETSLFSLQTTLKDFFSHMTALRMSKKRGLIDTDNTHIDPSVLSSSIAYTIATHEVSQRTIDEMDPKLLTSLKQNEQEQLLTLIESARAYHLLNEKTRQLSQELLQAVYNSIFVDGSILLVNHEALQVKELPAANNRLASTTTTASSPQIAEEMMIPPLLTCDLFSLFVRLLLLKPSLIQWSEYNEMLQLFYVAHIVQSLLMIVYRHKSLDNVINMFAGDHMDMSDDTLNASNRITSIQSAMDHIVKHFIIPNQNLLRSKLINTTATHSRRQNILDNEEQVLKASCLAFMRRMSLLTSILYQSGIPTVDSDYDLDLLNEQEKYSYEFDKLRRYLGLPDMNTIYHNMSNGSECSIMISKWFNQLTHSMNATALHPRTTESEKQKVITRLLPRYSIKPRQFHFVELPNLYQTLFLKYHNAECPNCCKKLQLPALCLISGKLVWCRQCDCVVSKSREDPGRIVGKCTEWARENYCGVGFFLLIPLSTVLLLRETRKSVLPPFYLDQHGEADNQLVRGCALYLNQQRLNSYVKHFVRNDWDQDTILLESTDGVNSYKL